MVENFEITSGLKTTHWTYWIFSSNFANVLILNIYYYIIILSFGWLYIKYRIIENCNSVGGEAHKGFLTQI